MHDFRRLEIWQESVRLASAIYRITDELPSSEKYGLTAQLRSAAVSIGSNIAEGAGRGSKREMARFLRNALGSVAEVETQLEICVELGLIRDQTPILESLNSLRRRTMTLHDGLLEIAKHNASR